MTTAEYEARTLSSEFTETVKRFSLTPAEQRVARLLIKGENNKAIAATLGLSEHTARHHTERVLRKLDIRSRAGVAYKLLAG